MTTARGPNSQLPPAPSSMKSAHMDGGERLLRRPSRVSADPDELVEFTKRALDESAEKQRAHIDHADVPQAWVSAAGDTLELSHKGIRTLPLEVIDLIRDRVERLALSHNEQSSLPTELSLCTRLYYLNLRWNNFSEFPEAVLLLNNLQTLDLSRNNITAIPDDIRKMTSLKFLAFTNNQVTHLPLTLGEMTSLTKLRFDDNPIQFPPPDEYMPGPEARQRSGFDSNTYICGQVKRYMRREKERQRQEMEPELSESNLDTPKPLKRTNTGRFPVRPSINGITNSDSNSSSVESVFGDGRVVADPRTFAAPTIPHKSVARDSLTIPPVRRPGLAPISTQGSTNRSRSETVTSAGSKLKRLGYVPSRKASGPPSANGVTRDPTLARSSSAHSRNHSFAPSPDGSETPVTATASPQDSKHRRPWVPKSRLSSLPEDRRISKITSPTIRSARLLVYSLDRLARPLDDAIRIMRSDNQRLSTTERLHVNATQNLKELDAQLHILTPINATQAQESKDMRLILKRSRCCVQAYQQVVVELRLSAKKLTQRGDPMYLRALMLQIYACLLEVRNACSIQEQTISPVQQSRFSSISQARSDRTVTPTQPKPSSKRARGAKIIASMRDSSSPASASFSSTIPSMMMSAASSRTTTMTSMSLATPKSGGSYNPHPLSRSSTMTSSTQIDSDEAGQFEKIYCSLKNVCELADQTLISCRQDFFVRKEGAARSMLSTAARAWTLALSKCDLLMHALDLLKKKMTRMRLNDPANRKSRDFWLVCDSFFNAWYELASEMKTLGLQGLDVGSIKPMLRPVQRAIKEASHLVNTSSLVKRSFESSPTGPASAAMQRQHSMPPTPLSAALGPAIQATVPNTPGIDSAAVSPADYVYGYAKMDKERERERSDTVTSRYGNGYRVR